TPPADEPAPPTGEAVYAEGLRLYRAGRYDEAIARFAAVQAPTALRVQALKHAAFSYCVTNRLPSCQRAFQDALALAPGFRLSKAERGHPVWGPVFDKALRQSQPARRRR
ncbi:TssQ family T6SS-associated lipoprotein, partial [Ottowia beijingensis]|uniref:TssQ family T6SS-associated lipoprotein n=1 Tax=Ottowia beijingensis TaxID=1207057 RepID=UPI002FDA110F